MPTALILWQNGSVRRIRADSDSSWAANGGVSMALLLISSDLDWGGWAAGTPRRRSKPMAYCCLT